MKKSHPANPQNTAYALPTAQMRKHSRTPYFKLKLS